jgi:superfamily II DNA or RNA helicase/HKD family nuclease
VSELRRGLYEVLVTDALQARLDELPSGRHHVTGGLRPAEAADRIALHLSREIERALDALPDDARVAVGIEVARELIERLAELAKGDRSQAPVEPAALLHAIVGLRPDGAPEELTGPDIPLLDTTLLTNAPSEPRVGHQIRAEIASADAIDVVMAFIRRSGITPLGDELRRHCERGLPLRVLTTTYTGSTERAALDLLRELGADVRVSYDVSTTRLHAKAWLFHRHSGFSTTYIGSSNLTHSAQVSGLEWNVRASAARNPTVVAKVAAVFESYWEGGEFRPYDPDQFEEELRRSGGRDTGPAILLSPIELRPEPFQERLLELIALSRERGHHRNLLVAATGTGKTVMAAVDYGRLRERLPRSRLLFVAHREEILDQSLATFRYALRDPDFGEKWVRGSRPTHYEHVFASIQSLRAADLDNLPADHFDVVIVDEFHHAAAPSYERLLSHVHPVELLGLTATPERSDGLSVLHWFDDRIAAELRLWDAIDQHRLTPFLYYGISDGLDLREIPWRRGRGYDVEALSNLYTSTDAWARKVVQEVGTHVDDVAAMRCLGFCVSVEHARFMARHFKAAGITAVAVWADTPDAERRQALRDLAAGRVQAVFSVDLFNEGVDVPAVDTVLMLRPTESPTLFLQQLGRGLRRSHDKAYCTVLDFVGTHRKEFRFDRRLRALLGGTRRDLEQAVKDGFPFLPAGCHMELDAVASDVVLRSLRDAIPSRWPQKVEELRALVGSGRPATLTGYLEHAGLEVEDVYAGNKSWSDLCDDAGVAVAEHGEHGEHGEHEVALRRGLGRLLHLDDGERLDAARRFCASTTPPAVDTLGVRDRRLLRMLVAALADQVLTRQHTLQAAVDLVWRHPQVRTELLELVDVLDQRVDHLHQPLATHPDVPLQLHARYTRVEILAAFGASGEAKVASWQSGVMELPAEGVDLFAFTLDKTSGSFSPTTRYRDYAISRERIHWESQSVTRADSDTGQRYQHHEAMDRHIMLFTRHRTDDRAFWFLGPARYVSHVGEKPMAITWQFEVPLPGDLFASFAAAVA